MQPAQIRAAEARLVLLLGELTRVLGGIERQTHASEYVRGLLLDRARKSITPITGRARNFGGPVRTRREQDRIIRRVPPRDTAR